MSKRMPLPKKYVYIIVNERGCAIITTPTLKEAKRNCFFAGDRIFQYERAFLAAGPKS